MFNVLELRQDKKPWVLWRGALVFIHLTIGVCPSSLEDVEVSPQVPEDTGLHK